MNTFSMKFPSAQKLPHCGQIHTRSFRTPGSRIRGAGANGAINASCHDCRNPGFSITPGATRRRVPRPRRRSPLQLAAPLRPGWAHPHIGKMTTISCKIRSPEVDFACMLHDFLVVFADLQVWSSRPRTATTVASGSSRGTRRRETPGVRRCEICPRDLPAPCWGTRGGPGEQSRSRAGNLEKVDFF